jgi:uncharacterized protein with HEPN domain/GNAT superfamily N-acetyltransferase
MSGGKNFTVLRKMLKYCDDSRKYAIGKTLSEFTSDERSLVFSIFSLSQLGELVTVLDKSFTAQYNEIPWNALKSIRNRIVHDYEGVQYKIIWNIIQNEIPVLAEAIHKILQFNMRFVDIKTKLCEPEVKRIISLSMYMPTPEKINSVIENSLADDKRNVYGVEINGIITGVVGFSIRADNGEAVVIHHIAVAEAYQRKGVGRFIIESLLKEYQLPIELETDDDAVGFYRRCGFETTALMKHGVRRWKCRLPVLK